MANIPGTIPLGGAIAPQAELDTYSTHFTKYGNGGWRSVSSIAERDAITPERREEGMVVYIRQPIGKEYELIGGITNSHWQIRVNKSGDISNDIKLAQSLGTEYNNSGQKQQIINGVGLPSVETYTLAFTKYASTDFGTVHSMIYVKGYIYMSSRQMPARIAKVNPNDFTDFQIFTFPGSNSSSQYSVADRMIYSEHTGKIYIPFGDPDYNRNVLIAEINPDDVSDYTTPMSYATRPGFPTGIAIGNKLYVLTSYQARLLEFDLDTYSVTRNLALPSQTFHAINSDGVDLFLSAIYPGAQVHRVSLDTFTITQSVTLPTKHMTDEFAIVGDNLWIGHESSFDAVNKGIYIVNKNDLSDYKILYVEETDSSWSIFYDGKYVWSVYASDPGIALRINPETLEIRRLNLGSSMVSPNSVAYDGNNIFITNFEVPVILTRITVPKLYDDMYYAGTDKDVLLKISNLTKTIEQTKTTIVARTNDGSIAYAVKNSLGTIVFEVLDNGTIRIGDSNTTISKDVLGNMTFTDIIAGTRTLKQMSPTDIEEVFIVDATIVTNGYVTLSNTPISGAKFDVSIDGMAMSVGASDDYEVSGAVVTIHQTIEIGDKIMIKYKY
jgi:hypothetical protein